MKNLMNKGLSVLLTLTIVLSAMLCSFTASLAAEIIYYVSATGSDTNNGTTQSTPVTSVAKAVELANLNYGEGDTVTIKVMGTQVDLGTIPVYAYDLIVEGVESTQTQLSIGSKTSADIANNETGTTRYKNVQFYTTQSSASYYMNSSKNVIFESDVVGFGGNKSPILGSSSDGGASKTISSQNIEFNNSNLNYIYVGNSGYQNRTITEDLTITVNTTNLRTPNFYLNPSTNSWAKYKKNLNFNIKSAKDVIFTNKGEITVDGAIQIINSTSANITLENAVLSAIDCEKFILNNNTGDTDIITFTSDAGIYNVKSELVGKIQVVATSDSGKTYSSDNEGVLRIKEAGEYSLSTEKKPEYATYYVDSDNGLSTNTGTKESPVKIITDAISLGINAGYTKGDTVKVVMLPGDENVEWGIEERTPLHDFKLVVESYDYNNCRNVNVMHATYLGGPTELRYGKYDIDDTYSQLRLNDKDFKIGKGAVFSTTYYTFGDNSTSNTVPGQKVVFENDIASPYINVTNGLHSNSKKYSGDIDITVNNPEAKPIFRLSVKEGTVYYKANINVNVKDALAVSFAGSTTGVSSNVCEGAIQVIINSNSQFDEDSLYYLENVCKPAKGFYHIVNNTEFKDLLAFTKTAGKYAVDTNAYDVTAVGENGTFTAKDGFLILDYAGKYTVTATKKISDVDNTIYEKIEDEILSVWENNGEIVIDNAESTATLDFGDKEYNNIKINVLNAEQITFTGNPTINGSLQIAVNSDTQIVNKSIIDDIVAPFGKWYITNTSGQKISFGEEAGEILFSTHGKQLEAVSGESVVEPWKNNILLTKGEHTIRVKSKPANICSEYIDYRGDNLSNTYAKLENNEELNVVFFGGSITDGTGASGSAYCWRSLIGSWLKNTYTDVNITNINSAIGATGTEFGLYRLEEYVLKKNPDLMFIDFSVNDYLDLHYSGRDPYDYAARQMETIIRRVRKALPECDIVMVHTVDKNTAPKLYAGEYYLEAQAHNDIAKEYDIPTLNIGKALVDAMGENYNTDEVWYDYFIDTAHPKDSAYKIYAAVVKEYLSNCLLYTEHNGQIENHEIPPMVSDRLLDGDITFIDANKELLEKSIALGGSGFEYRLGERHTPKEYGSIISTNNQDSLFVFEFEGTELALVFGNTSFTGFMVKIDDGDYEFVSKYAKPIILATGLEAGKHKAYIKPCSNGETVVVNLVNFYVHDESKASKLCSASSHVYDNFDATVCSVCGRGERAAAKYETYYVGTALPDGVDEGTTIYATVDEAIIAANNKGHNERSCITVLVDATNGTTWRVTDGVTTAHTFNLIVDTATESKQATISFTANTTLGGNTSFGNIYISIGGTRWLAFDGHDVTFGQNSKINTSYVYTGKGGYVTETYPSQKIIFNNAWTAAYFKLASDNYGATYTGNVDITINNSSASPTINLGGNAAASVYENINIDIKNAKAITLKNYKEALVPTVNGAISIINSCGVTITDTNNNLNRDDVKVYMINNISGNANLISFTGTVGKYAVNVDPQIYDVFATDSEGKIFNAVGGFLTLPVGEYTIDAVKVPLYKTIYVQTGATGANDTYATLAQAIQAAIDEEYTKGDVITVKLLGETVESGTLPTYNFELIVEGSTIVGDDSTKPTRLSVTSLILANNEGNLTTYKNVEIYLSGQYHVFQLASSNAIFESSVHFNHSLATFAFGTGNDGGGNKYVAGQSLIYKATGIRTLSFANGSWSGRKYDDDVNLVIETDSNPQIQFNSYYSDKPSGTTVYNKNVNINFKKANGTEFINAGGATFNGAIQIINSTAINITYNHTALAEVTADKYIITNKTGDNEIIEFTDKTGIYSIKGEKTVRAINMTKGGYADSVDGVLDISLLGAGEYVLAFPTDYNDYEGTDTYAEYIADRTALNGNHALNNVSAKINKGEHINVVYFGGSVTNGQGSSWSNRYSWRGLISTWLEVNAPNSTVTNINSAIGGTGSFFGNYRLQEAVLDKQPDLLFIEFSINDNYENISETEAARRFETIIRRVRTELPQCDIVMLLTTDKGLIPNLKNSDTLHSQAQGHDSIAESYGIPTLRVGHALADTLSDNWTDNDYAEWYQYVTDTVHPNDNGYMVYGNVVTEFLANSLFVHNKDAITVVNHIMPTTIVSEELLDGDIRVYEITEEMANASEMLGYDKPIIETGDSRILYFDNYFNFQNELANGFAFEFTNATELVAVLHNNRMPMGVKIIRKSDGEIVSEKTSEFSGLGIDVLASSLNPGETYIAVLTGSDWIRLHALITRNASLATNKSNVNGDINKDSVFDIRDLVCAEMIKDNTIDFAYNFEMADRNEDGIVSDEDIVLLRVELLSDGNSTAKSNTSGENLQVVNLKSQDAIVEKKTLALAPDQKSKRV